MQNKVRAFEVGKKHYDIGNELYHGMLDKRMVYTCGYWKDAKNLDGAQEAKLDLVCKKIGLKKGMKILDIGCGWSSFAKYAAEKYDVKVVGITISKEQVKLGNHGNTRYCLEYYKDIIATQISESSSDPSDIPEKCMLHSGRDKDSWNEHLDHHQETQKCLKYFD